MRGMMLVRRRHIDDLDGRIGAELLDRLVGSCRKIRRKARRAPPGAGRPPRPARRADRGTSAASRVNARPSPATPMRSLRHGSAQHCTRPRVLIRLILDIRSARRMPRARNAMTPEENDLLCRVEGDAPMGQIMRRHWIAACLSEEVAEPDGTPLRVKLLGENLVVFRDSKGRLGVLDEFCAHRRASLVYARNEECGLRCLYHGWKFDVEGNVVEMASEPAESKHSGAREAEGLSGARGRRLRVVLHGAGGRNAGVRAAGVRADAGRARLRHQGAGALQLGADPRRPDRLGAFVEPAFLRHGAGAGRRREGDRQRTGCGPRPTRRRASRSSAPPTASATRRSAARSRTRRRTTTSAPRSTSRRSPR